jgi:hypothetical protein
MRHHDPPHAHAVAGDLPGSSVLRLVLPICLLLSLAGTQRANAQNALGGSWRAGATSVDVAVESWGGDCGPRPTSTRSGGGGLVNLEQKEQVLIVHGRDQDIRSDACWSRNPAMKRTTASFSGGVWITRCRTSDTDPRAEQGTYTLKLLTPDSLFYQDISHYDWSLNTSKCVATFTTSQTLSRGNKTPLQPAQAHAAPRAVPEHVEAAPATGTPSNAGTATLDEDRACKPGAPAHIAVRPRRVDIEVGQHVCLHARVSDAADCTVRNADVDWILVHSKALRGTLSYGCFTAASSAAEAQGDFRVTARSSGLSADAIVTVKPIDLSAVLAKRMEGSGLTGFDESGEAIKSAPPKAVSHISTHTSTQAEGGGKHSLWIVGLCIAAILLGVFGWLYNRRPRAAAISGEPAQRLSFPEANVPSASRDESEKSAPVTTSPPAASEEPDKSWICPLCRVGYPAHQATCPKDGTALMPYGEFAKLGRKHDEEHAKRCPTCGRTYPASAGFCGDDGTALVDN